MFPDHGNKWFKIVPKNVDLFACQLGNDAVDYLWKCIDYAKKDKRNVNEIVYLEDKDDYFFNTHLKEICRQYIREYYYCSSLRNAFSINAIDECVMKEFWINLSKKHQFVPVHSHGGALSFVIWMDIPTRSKEQHNLPMVAPNIANTTSDFQFLYNDICGSIHTQSIEMDPETRGRLLLFPATINHLVYPFYECDGTRVSISGNIYFNTKDAFSEGSKDYYKKL